MIKMSHYFLFGLYALLIFFAVACKDASKYEVGSAAGRMNPQSKGKSSAKEFDVYKFENDSLVQYAFVHYLTPKKIVFRVSTYNKKDGKSCELADTASITASDVAPDPSAYSDEQAGDELYAAYEFLYDRGRGLHTVIGVEPSRGSRLRVQTALSTQCGPFTPLESMGTLRRVTLSSVKQEGPHLPAMPK